MNRIWAVAAASCAAGLATMVIEIAAGRVLAPIMGVSLYSWTALIGVVLGGLALGGWISGWLSDRLPADRVLVAGALVGAVGGFSVLVLAELAPKATLIPTSDVIGRTLWITGAVVLLPSLGLGAVTPAAARLAIRASADAGRAVGTVYAAGTAGSIAGVFLTGFLLVDVIGSRASIALAGVLALLAALVVRPPRFGWRLGLGAAVVAAPLGLAAAVGVSLAGPCTWESAYFCIQIIEEQYIGGRLSRSVRLDRLIHGSIYIDDPTYLDFGYLRVMADLTDVVRGEKADMKTLLIGGGSYTLPRYVEARYPDADVDVVEIDPKVTRTAYAFLGLRPDSRVRNFNVDARQFFLDDEWKGHYDVIYGDAFNDLSIPYHLTTSEFAGLVSEALRPGGVYLANVIDLYGTGRFLRSFIATLRTRFEFVYLVVDLATFEIIGPTAPPADPSSDRRRTFIAVASSHPIDFASLGRVSNGSAFLIDPAQVQRYVDDPRTLVLTDEHAPVDRLVAPIFLARPF